MDHQTKQNERVVNTPTQQTSVALVHEEIKPQQSTIGQFIQKLWGSAPDQGRQVRDVQNQLDVEIDNKRKREQREDQSEQQTETKVTQALQQGVVSERSKAAEHSAAPAQSSAKSWSHTVQTAMSIGKCAILIGLAFSPLSITAVLGVAVVLNVAEKVALVGMGKMATGQAVREFGKELAIDLVSTAVIGLAVGKLVLFSWLKMSANVAHEGKEITQTVSRLRLGGAGVHSGVAKVDEFRSAGTAVSGGLKGYLEKASSVFKRFFAGTNEQLLKQSDDLAAAISKRGAEAVSDWRSIGIKNISANFSPVAAEALKTSLDDKKRQPESDLTKSARNETLDNQSDPQTGRNPANPQLPPEDLAANRGVPAPSQIDPNRPASTASEALNQVVPSGEDPDQEHPAEPEADINSPQNPALSDDREPRNEDEPTQFSPEPPDLPDQPNLIVQEEVTPSEETFRRVSQTSAVTAGFERPESPDIERGSNGHNEHEVHPEPFYRAPERPAAQQGYDQSAIIGALAEVTSRATYTPVSKYTVRVSYQVQDQGHENTVSTTAGAKSDNTRANGVEHAQSTVGVVNSIAESRSLATKTASLISQANSEQLRVNHGHAVAEQQQNSVATAQSLRDAVGVAWPQISATSITAGATANATLAAGLVSQPQSVAIAGAISNQDLSYEGQLNKVSSPAEPRELRVGSKQLVERDREVALVGEQRASNPDASVASARLEPGVNQSKGSISIAELARAGELIQMVAKSEEEAKLLVQDLEVINSEVLIQSSEAEQLEITSDEHQQSKAGSKGRLKAAAKNISDERIRQLIIQQLLNQAFDQARRDRMLRMLLALGISESEYMALLGKLEMIEAERVTEATTEALLNEVDHSDKQAAEVEPSVTAKPGMENHEPIELPRRNLTRADLYQRLKQSDASDSE